MKFVRISFLAFVITFLTQPFIAALGRREIPIPMRTSVIVPCHYKHFYLLPDLIDYYAQQHVRPDEFIISLTTSQKKYIPTDLIECVLTKQYPFVVKIVEDENEYPGENRNAACRASTGDILLCQDADDLPHPQRMEFIKYLFENYKVDFLIHRLFLNEGNFPNYSLQDIVHNSCYVSDYSTIFDRYGSISNGVHNGVVVITRAVFDQFQWPDFKLGEDMTFNRHVIESHQFHTVVTDAYLILYRNYLSSYQN